MSRLLGRRGSLFQSLHDLSMRRKNSGGLFRLWCEGPVAVVPGAAQNYPVAAREHVAVGEITVINLRLRQKYFQLAAHRFQLLITEERAGAQAGAVKDDWLGQTLDFFTTVKFLYHQFASGDVEVAQQRVEIYGRLDQHRVVLFHIRKAKVIIGIAVNFLPR